MRFFVVSNIDIGFRSICQQKYRIKFESNWYFFLATTIKDAVLGMVCEAHFVPGLVSNSANNDTHAAHTNIVHSLPLST